MGTDSLVFISLKRTVSNYIFKVCTKKPDRVSVTSSSLWFQSKRGRAAFNTAVFPEGFIMPVVWPLTFGHFLMVASNAVILLQHSLGLSVKPMMDLKGINNELLSSPLSNSVWFASLLLRFQTLNPVFLWEIPLMSHKQAVCLLQSSLSFMLALFQPCLLSLSYLYIPDFKGKPSSDSWMNNRAFFRFCRTDHRCWFNWNRFYFLHFPFYSFNPFFLQGTGYEM